MAELLIFPIFILYSIKHIENAELPIYDLWILRVKQEDQQKLNRQKEANQDANGKGIDEKEDFLHQIRTKVSSYFVL